MEGCDEGNDVGLLVAPSHVGREVKGTLVGTDVGNVEGTVVGKADGTLVGCPDGSPEG